MVKGEREKGYDDIPLSSFCDVDNDDGIILVFLSFRIEFVDSFCDKDDDFILDCVDSRFSSRTCAW